jgi:hypothetical protein
VSGSSDLAFAGAVEAIARSEFARWRESNLTDLDALRAAAARATEAETLIEGADLDDCPARTRLLGVARSHGYAARLRRLVAHEEVAVWDRTAGMLEAEAVRT